MKTVLDGTLETTPDNLLLYATSNRRHLLPEQRSDNLAASMVDGELHQLSDPPKLKKQIKHDIDGCGVRQCPAATTRGGNVQA